MKHICKNRGPRQAGLLGWKNRGPRQAGLLGWKKSCDSLAAALVLASLTVYAFSQDTSPGSQTPPPQSQKETHITPEQAKELFRSLNQILSFASDDTHCRSTMR